MEDRSCQAIGRAPAADALQTIAPHEILGGRNSKEDVRMTDEAA